MFVLHAGAFPFPMLGHPYFTQPEALLNLQAAAADHQTGYDLIRSSYPVIGTDTALHNQVEVQKLVQSMVGMGGQGMEKCSSSQAWVLLSQAVMGRLLLEQTPLILDVAEQMLCPSISSRPTPAYLLLYTPGLSRARRDAADAALSSKKGAWGSTAARMRRSGGAGGAGKLLGPPKLQHPLLLKGGYSEVGNVAMPPYQDHRLRLLVVCPEMDGVLRMRAETAAQMPAKVLQAAGAAGLQGAWGHAAQAAKAYQQAVSGGSS